MTIISFPEPSPRLFGSIPVLFSSMAKFVLLRLCDYNAVVPKLNRILGEFICYGHVNKTNMYLNLCEYLRITHFTAICPTLGGFILLFGCQF